MGLDKKDEKPINWALLITGAVASAFVGTLYGYSYLKGGITDYWKYYATTESTDLDEVAKKVNSYSDGVDIAYYAGFFGQYLAIFPGLVFDAFGATVTCLYGGTLCATGFIMVGLGVRNVVPVMVIVGLCLAGQGSKGLGFGTLLGTIRNSPESMCTLISGLYLMLDAMSAVICLKAYDFYKEANNFTTEEEKASGMMTFFIALGSLIGAVGVSAGLMYYFFTPKAEAEVSVADLEKQANRKSVNSATGRRSSIADEARLVSGKNLDESSDEEDEEEQQPLTGEKKHAPTFWKGVICCYLVMLLSESQGLAFNNAIGDAFMASRKSKIGIVTWNKLQKADVVNSKDAEGNFNTDFKTIVQQLKPQRGTNLSDSQKDANKIIKEVQTQFANVPKYMHVSSAQDNGIPVSVFNFRTSSDASAEVRSLSLKYLLKDVEFNTANASKFALAADKVLMTSNRDANNKKIVQDCTMTTPCDVLDLYFGADKFQKVDDLLQKALDKLTPVSGWQVRTENGETKVHLLHAAERDTFNSDGAVNGNVGHHLRNLIALQKQHDQQKSMPSIFADNTINKKKAGKSIHKIGATDAEVAARKTEGGQTEKWQYERFHYPQFANDFAAVEKMPFKKWIGNVVQKSENGQKIVQVAFFKTATGVTAGSSETLDLKLEIQQNILLTVDSEDAKIYYDPWKLARTLDAHNDSHEHIMKDSIKKYLTITFTLGNAFGRLGVGLLMEFLAKRVWWMPSAIWFVIGCALYGLFFTLFAAGGVPCTHSDHENNAAAPFGLWFMTAFIAVLYGGIFTINTAYMKSIVHPQQLGLVLGGSLVVLAIGSFVFGKIFQDIWEDYDFAKSVEPVGTKSRHVFFVIGAGVQLLAVVPACYCWMAQTKKIKDAMKADVDDEDTE
ncbi:unnamed protein product [Amoebophrya sp. A120]|nr:unnamed protein product [Amoebophrya sp. A120]|eukprot:GSA120T00022984001.1